MYPCEPYATHRLKVKPSRTHIENSSPDIMQSSGRTQISAYPANSTKRHSMLEQQQIKQGHPFDPANWRVGAGDGDRTRDVQLGKLAEGWRGGVEARFGGCEAERAGLKRRSLRLIEAAQRNWRRCHNSATKLRHNAAIRISASPPRDYRLTTSSSQASRAGLRAQRA